MVTKINTEGAIVHTTLDDKRGLKRIVRTQSLGRQPRPLLFQPPKFKDVPIVFCSYVCNGYRETYGNREGVQFETDAQVVYACPVDTHDLLRDGSWLPGHERFIFRSIEEMLDKYPTSEDYKRAFQEYFRRLQPLEVYPHLEDDQSFASLRHRTDYCLRRDWNPGCNEIAFPKPLKIKNSRVFNSREELDAILAEQK